MTQKMRKLFNVIQGGPSGCTLPFVEIKTKVPSQYSLLTPKVQNATLNLMSTKCSVQPQVQPDGPPCI